MLYTNCLSIFYTNEHITFRTRSDANDLLIFFSSSDSKKNLEEKCELTAQNKMQMNHMRTAKNLTYYTFRDFAC